MVDTHVLLEQYKDSVPVHGLPLYADYWADGKRVFTPEYGILAVILLDENGSCSFFGPNDFDVQEKNCSIYIPMKGSFPIESVFSAPSSRESPDIKRCFVLISPNPPPSGMIHFFPLERLEDY